MRSNSSRPSVGRHRKITTSQTLKSRVALAATAAGTISMAGAGGAAAGALQADAQDQPAPAADYTLAADAEALPESASTSAPQVLSIAEYKPVTGLDDQLNKAVQATNERAAEAAAAAQATAVEAVGQAQGLTTAGITGANVVKPAEGVFTSGFGMRWGSMHSGMDIAGPIGTPILAAMGGTVIDSGPAQGYGNWIRIQHDDGSIAVYGHMSTLDVSVGQKVVAGQQIAGMGNEGFSTGSHLHFQLHPGGGAAIDPVPWFAERGVVIA
ncbi:M23 family metallopeptidase [Corynebacterium doosanense]|uniref:Membrane protein n=1 Tax=Corynebacterium doosanense CAU 212 = DSM 45436 TaxID=558173 RepID=A0A097ICY7_9CORY|nr:M23 family metallopeptidase [Corynebacterium doosanense]AIT59988.1 membrane protein [Corynebacterium doosanense CAU 212 = DSM 45436]